MRLGIILGACMLSALTASGCVSPRADTAPPHLYRLDLGWGHDAGRSGTCPSSGDGPVLLVSTPLAEPGYETSKMVYMKRPHELEHYAVNQWADQPARMFASLLVQSLGRRGSWCAVVPVPASVRGDLRLDTYGFSLHQEFMQSPSRVRVAVRAQLVDLKESRIRGTRSFERVEQAPTDDAYGGVLAANRATAALLDELTSWLRECAQRSSECSQ